MKKYLPLAVMIFLVVALTAIISISSGDMSGSFLMRMFMGSFFFVFGGLKILRVRSFAKAYREYDLIAMRSGSYAHAHPFIEMGLALGYFTNAQPLLINIITIAVMSLGAAGVLIKLLKREKVLCACLGTVFKVPMT